MIVQADDNGGIADPGNVTPTLAVDSTNVYFFSPADGTLLSAPIDNPGSLSPKVLATATGPGDSGTIYGISGLVVDDANVYFLSTSEGVVRSVPIDGGAVTTFSVGGGFSISTATNSSSLTLDSSNLYVANGTMIARGPKDAGSPLVTVGKTDAEYVFGGIAVDAANIYWAECVYESSSCSINGWSMANDALFELSPSEVSTTSLAISPTAVFWGNANNGGSPGTLRTAPKDGGAPATTIEGASFSNQTATSLTIDPATSTLYWIQANGNVQAPGTLAKMPADGGVPVVIATNAWGPPVFDASGNVYYMVSPPHNGGQPGYVQVWRSPK
jgi:hypothetical protein